MSKYGIVSSFGMNLDFGARNVTKLNFNLILLKMANFIELIHQIPNFLEIWLLLTVVLPIYFNGLIRMAK